MFDAWRMTENTCLVNTIGKGKCRFAAHLIQGNEIPGNTK